MRALVFLALLHTVEPGGCGGAPPAVPTQRALYGLALRTSGAVLAERDHDAPTPMISSERSHGPGFTGAFVPSEGPFQRVELAVNAVPEGATGTAFPTQLRLQTATRVYESTNCSARIDSQTFQTPRGPSRPTGRSYVVTGSVSCEQSLHDPNVLGDELVVEHFAFSLPVAWDFSHESLEPHTP